MQNLNSTEDVKIYLSNGKLSQPFLEKEQLERKILQDINAKQSRGVNISMLEGILNWCHHNVKFSKDEEFRKYNKFKRTAKEVWESGQSTGCNDFALIFATFARQLGISTTILHTAEENWLKSFHAGEDFSIYSGHAFCECFYEGKWVLVDPTKRKIMEGYNSEKIELDYSLGGGNVFIPFDRAIDLGKSKSMREFTQEMEKQCKDIN